MRLLRRSRRFPFGPSSRRLSTLFKTGREDMNADSSQLRGDTAASAGPAPKRKRSKKDEDDELPEKKNKACHSCRRVKVSDTYAATSCAAELILHFRLAPLRGRDRRAAVQAVRRCQSMHYKEVSLILVGHRCTARGEECTFTTPLHDLKWQETVTARVDHMSETVKQFLQAIGPSY